MKLISRSRLKRLKLYLVDIFSLLAGYLKFKSTGQCPDTAYQAMIRLFCFSQGRSNHLISKCVSLLHPFRTKTDALMKSSQILTQEKSSLDKSINQLRHDGFLIFDTPFPQKHIDYLTRFALEQDADIKGLNYSDQKKSGKYNPSQPVAVKYDFAAQQLLQDPVIQELIADGAWWALAGEYLESEPILDIVTMWWNTDYSKVPNADAAQLFHFDMDCPKWLKFFVYLTDVGPQSGPHVFIKESHRDFGIPKEILARGYSRIDDQEIAKFYPQESLVEFTGKAGTVFAEDTRGLHKGKVIEKGHRLVFQLQFSNSLFGGARPRYKKAWIQNPKLLKLMQEHPRSFSLFE